VIGFSDQYGIFRASPAAAYIGRHGCRDSRQK
jgi:hypothetical protein